MAYFRNLVFGFTGTTHTNTLTGQSYSLNASSLSGITKLTTGAQVLGYTSKAANYTVADGDYTIDVSANSITITLPTAIARTGQVYVVKNSGDADVSLAAAVGQTIDGMNPLTLAVGKFYQVQSNGSNWIVIGTNVSSSITFSQISDASSPLQTIQASSGANDVVFYLSGGNSPASGSASPVNSLNVANGFVTSIS